MVVRLTPSGTNTSESRARRIASKTGRPPMVRVGARETGLMAKVNEATTRGNLWLVDLGLSYFIDEVAIMLPEAPKEAQDWHERMLDRVGTEGITYFNRSRSTVTVHSLPSKYEVEYHFFTTAIEGVRIELMRLGNGHSPLHALYNSPVRSEDSRGRDACVVHASFKVPNGDEQEYRMVCSVLAGAGWTCGQDCSSEYGLFGYWRKPDDEGSLLWLKPRVNLRDVPKPPSKDPDADDLLEDEGTDFQYPNYEAEKAGEPDVIFEDEDFDV